MGVHAEVSPARSVPQSSVGESEMCEDLGPGISCTTNTRRLRRSPPTGSIGQSFGQASSHSGANIVCCAACTTAGRSGRSTKSTIPLTRNKSLPRVAGEPAERAGEVETGDRAAETDGEGVDPVGMGGDRFGRREAPAQRDRAAANNTAPGSPISMAEMRDARSLTRSSRRIKSEPSGLRSVLLMTRVSASAA